MIVFIIILIWLVGYIFSIHPIYSSLMRGGIANTERRRALGYTDDTEVTSGDVVVYIMAATILGTGWFLATPFYVSHFLRSRHQPNLEQEIEIFKEQHIHAQELKSRMARARKEIEITSTDADGW